MMALNLTVTRVTRKLRIETFLGVLVGPIRFILDFISFFSPFVVIQNIQIFHYEFLNLKNYLVALMVLLFTQLIILLFSNITHTHPYIFLTAPVIINALYGGIGPAVFSIIIGVIFSNSISNGFQLNRSLFQIQPVDLAFIIEGFVISWISISQKRRQQSFAINLLQEQNARLKAQNTSQNLKRLEKQKDDFIAIAAHELKNPLASIKAFTQILDAQLAPGRDSQTKHYLTKLDEQTNRLDELVNQLFDVSSMSMGQMKLHKKSVYFDEFILSTIIDLQHTISTHKLVIEGHTKSDVDCDLARIREVIVNLVTNAVKYSPEAKEIIVHISATNEQVVFSVKDFGPGIKPDDQKRIFERFYRTGSYQVSGLGLGLYIASEIVRLHQGKIWLNSTPGKGATFFFSLPKK